MTKVAIVKKHGKKWGKKTLKRFDSFGKAIERKMQTEIGKVLKMESFRVLKSVKREGLGFYNPKLLQRQALFTAKRVAHQAILAGKKTLDREIKRGRSHNLTPANFVQKRKVA